MGVLDPIEEKADAVHKEKDENIEMLDLTLDSLQKYGPALVADNYEILEDENPYLFMIWRDEEVGQ